MTKLSDMAEEKAAEIWASWSNDQRYHYHMWSYQNRIDFIGAAGVETGNMRYRDHVDTRLVERSRREIKA